MISRQTNIEGFKPYLLFNMNENNPFPATDEVPERDNLSAKRTAATYPPPKNRRRILLIDDNEDSVEMMAMFLGMEGYDTRSALDAKAAFAIARDFKPEICLCDIALPGMDGYELAGMLRELLPNAMLVSVSGWSQAEDIELSREAGFLHHLVKPVDFGDILSVIAELD